MECVSRSNALALVAAALTVTIGACTYDVSELRGHGADAATGSLGDDADAEHAHVDSLADDSAGGPDGAGASSARDGGTGGMSTGGAGTGGMDAGGAAGSPGRSLGSGCGLDADCASGICTMTTGGVKACCDRRPDQCSACVNGYVTAANEGAPVDDCNSCKAGSITPVAEGHVCGTAASTCVGTPVPTGFPSGSTYQPQSESHACHAGQCVATVVDCTTINCPSTCNLKYRGCVSGPCWCVDTGGAVCN